MIDLRHILHRNRKAVDLPCSEEVPEASCLVITGDPEFLGRVRNAAACCRWPIHHACSFAEAVGILGEEEVSLAVYDSDLQDDDWRLALPRLTAMESSPCVLLASRVADDYLWQEVIRHHGYDILAKSAGQDHLVRTLQFAWFWRKSLRPLARK